MSSRKRTKVTANTDADSGPLSDTEVSPKPSRRDFQHPWPRSAEDGTALGVDVQKEHGRLRALALRYFSRPQTRAYIASRVGSGHRGRELDREDFAQEVMFAIWRRNHYSNPYDPRRACLSTYVFEVAFSVLSHLTDAEDHSRLPFSALGVNVDAYDSLAVPDSEWGRAYQSYHARYGADRPGECEIDAGPGGLKVKA